MTEAVTAMAPGRVNLIGDHTDYAGGTALPMAIDLTTTATYTAGGDVLEIRSTATGHQMALHPGDHHQPGSFGAMVTGLLEVLGPRSGLLEVSSTLPLGAGLSSSASLLIAGALALGAEQRGVELALLCQEAERLAGQDVGLLDQMAIIGGQAGHAVLIDFADLTSSLLPLPDDLEIVIVHSGQDRSLAAGAYARRRAEVAAAEALIGSLRDASSKDLATIGDPLVARRAQHVAAECARVAAFCTAIAADPAEAGRLMLESHRSLSELFEVSTPQIDARVMEVANRPGVFGARMTGGGFGGCIVAIAEPGALDPTSFGRAWTVRAADGPSVSRDR